MIGIGRILHLRGIKPWAFSRRLIEMSVNTDVPFHNGLSETSGLMPEPEGYFIRMGRQGVYMTYSMYL